MTLIGSVGSLGIIQLLDPQLGDRGFVTEAHVKYVEWLHRVTCRGMWLQLFKRWHKKPMVNRTIAGLLKDFVGGAKVAEW